MRRAVRSARALAVWAIAGADLGRRDELRALPPHAPTAATPPMSTTVYSGGAGKCVGPRDSLRAGTPILCSRSVCGVSADGDAVASRVTSHLTIACLVSVCRVRLECAPRRVSGRHFRVPPQAARRVACLPCPHSLRPSSRGCVAGRPAPTMRLGHARASVILIRCCGRECVLPMDGRVL